MNLRKLLYLPTKEQLALLTADVERILNKCDKIASAEYKDQKDARDSHDSICPNCHVRKDGNNIVNKIREVHGKGSVSGSFSLGFGSVSGSMAIDTNEVNHCNNCGNEWKKFKVKYVSKTDVVRVALNYLGDIYEDPERNKKFSWKVEAIEVFDGCYAESISALMSKNSHYMRLTTKRHLTLHRLRLNFKTVFVDEIRNN